MELQMMRQMQKRWKKEFFPLMSLVFFLGVTLPLPAGGEEPSSPLQISLVTGETLLLGELRENPLHSSGALFRSTPPSQASRRGLARRSGLPTFGGTSGGASGAASGGLPSFGHTEAPQPQNQPHPQPGGMPSNPLLPPAQPGGFPGVPLTSWKQYNLTQAFGYDRTITGSMEYPSSWQANLDVYNRMVEFSDPRGRGTSCTLLPGIIGQFMVAPDLAGQLLSVLQQSIPHLQILQQEFNEDPTAAQSGMMVSKGRVLLSGYLGGSLPVKGMLMTYAVSVPGSLFGAGAAVLCLAPEGEFPQAVQEYFNRMIASYEKSLGIARFGLGSAGTEQGLSSALQSALGQ